MFNMKRLRELRKNQGITQREIAQYLGVSVSTFSGWETGIYQMDYEHLCKTADFFGVTVDELLGRSPQLFDDARVERPEIMELYELMTPQQQSNLINYARGMLAASASDEGSIPFKRRA